ncbi:zinc ribbon domain-containing protein [Alteromonas sp. 009811495]
MTISCPDCGFSELYKRQRNTTGTLLEFF